MIKLNKDFMAYVSDKSHDLDYRQIETMINAHIQTESNLIFLTEQAKHFGLEYFGVEIPNFDNKNRVNFYVYQDGYAYVSSFTEKSNTDIIGIGYCGSCAPFSKTIQLLQSALHYHEKQKQLFLF